MTDEQRLRYKELKQRYENEIKEKRLKNIKYEFEELGEKLGNNVHIFHIEDEERLNIYEKCFQKIPFSEGGLDKSKFKKFNIYYIKYVGDLCNNEDILKKCKYKDYYIILGRDFPIIKCEITEILKNMDDIHDKNYEFTILLSENFKQFIFIYHEGDVTIGEI